MRTHHPTIKNVTFTPTNPMRLWEVKQGTTTVRVRAIDHAEAMERAMIRFRMDHPESCRLVDGAAAKRGAQ